MQETTVLTPEQRRNIFLIRLVGLCCVFGYAFVTIVLPHSAFAQDQITSALNTTMTWLRALAGFVVAACVFYWFYVIFAFFFQGAFPSLWSGVSSTMRQGFMFTAALALGGAALFTWAQNTISTGFGSAK
jgi:hypothetical protein